MDKNIQTGLAMKAFFLSILLMNQALAVEVYVKSLKAPLLEKPAPGAASLIVLERGARLESSRAEGPFLRAQVQGKTGYINKLFVSDKPILGKDSILNKEIDISSKARKRASGFTSSAAARGLKEDSDDIFRSLGEAGNANRLREMEELWVNEATGAAFLEDFSRGLGPKKLRP